MRITILSFLSFKKFGTTTKQSHFIFTMIHKDIYKLWVWTRFWFLLRKLLGLLVFTKIVSFQSLNLWWFTKFNPTNTHWNYGLYSWIMLFSWGDVATNTIGLVLVFRQKPLFNEQIVKYKFSYWELCHSQNVNGFLGVTKLYCLFKHYNGHT